MLSNVQHIIIIISNRQNLSSSRVEFIVCHSGVSNPVSKNTVRMFLVWRNVYSLKLVILIAYLNCSIDNIQMFKKYQRASVSQVHYIQRESGISVYVILNLLNTFNDLIWPKPLGECHAKVLNEFNKCIMTRTQDYSHQIAFVI